MNPLLEQLHDIDGLDAISFWPLAYGWWAVIVFCTALCIVMAGWIYYRVAFKRSWKGDTLKKLALLEKNASEITARETVILLSEYLRRIALKRFSRKECASLMGMEWLNWLAQHDPKKFDWKVKGAPLISAPYSPADYRLPNEKIKELIKAVRNWVH